MIMFYLARTACLIFAEDTILIFSRLSRILSVSDDFSIPHPKLVYVYVYVCFPNIKFLIYFSCKYTQNL